jgi:hypothetical protein
MNHFLDRHKQYLKYLLLLSLITFVILFVARTAHGAWYNSNWQYRKRITIQSSQVSGGPHSNFPVLIKLTSDAELAANAQNNGDDILFTASNETTKIPHEIERFNGSTGELHAWVRVDSISSSNNKDIYMYYGNGSATNQENATGVWSNGFQGVWHLDESPDDDTTGAHEDSTSNSNDGTARDFQDGDGGSTSATGIAGGANSYAYEADDRVEIPDDSTLEPTGDLTAQAWVKFDSNPDGHIIYRQRTCSPCYSFMIYVEPSTDRARFDWYNSSGTSHQVEMSGSLATDTWYLIAGIHDASENKVKLYVKGGYSTSTASTSSSGTMFPADQTLQIGASWSGGDSPDGIIDEVRISNVVRSNDWLATEYTNLTDPGNFIVLHAYESEGGGGNQAPVVEAGATKVVTLPDTDVVLNDASAIDPDSGPGSLTTTWSQLSGPATVTFSPDVNELKPTVSGLTLEGEYELKLSAYDGEATVEDTVTITVNPAGSVDLSGYSCNMKITIKGSQVQGGPHSNFPVLISLTDESLQTSGCGFVTSDDGYDILFTDSTKTSQLNHEIERYDKDAGELLAWVRADLNASPSNTEVYMYYGKSGVGDQQNSTGVWDGDYVVVQHMNGASATALDDSTSNDNDVTSSGSDPYYQASGKIGYAVSFDGDDYVEIPDDSTLDLSSQVTVSAWIRPGSIGNWNRIVAKSHTSDSQPWTRYGLLFDDNDRIRMEISEGSTQYGVNGTSTVPTGSWTYGTVTYNGSTRTVYCNGDSENTATDTVAISTNDMPLSIARSGFGSDYFNGRIDEVRVSKVARTANWIKTEYNNQSDPSSFYSVVKDCPDTTPSIGEFTCNIPITIDSSKVSGSSNLNNFPVLISLTNTALKTTANCGYVQDSDGNDIIFSDAGQTTQLDHELENYDGTAGELVAWVRIPTLSATTDTTIYVHFGHSSVCGATENPTGVWNSDYVGVWHLDDTDNLEDSTSYNNDGTSSNVDDATGKIGIAQDFDGDDSILVDNSTSLDITGDEITLSAWVKMTGGQDDDAGILNKSYSADYNYMLNVQSDERANFRVRTNGSSTYLTGSTTLTVGQWYFIYGIYNGSTARLYVNNYQDGTDNRTGNIESAGEAPVNIGRRRTYPSADNRFFDGVIDEARISNVARSVDWMKTEYNNQSAPSSFYSVGPSSCSLTSFSCNRKITIDHNKVEGSTALENFPVLIHIENDCNLRTTGNDGSVESSNGYDIVFIDSDGFTQLDHEVEAYDGIDGEFTAWVKIPSLSPTTDTDIYIYYGNSDYTACDPSNPTGVWDSNYVGVWHLHDDYEDSSSYNNDGANNNSSDTSGQIADGQYFNGNDQWVEVSDDSSLHFTNQITATAWIRPTAAQDWDTILSKMSYQVSELYWVLDDNTLILQLDGPLGWDWWSDITVSNNEWAYLAFTYDDSTDTVTMYKNGGASTDSEYASGTLNLSTNNDPLYIGMNTGWSGEDFHGTIDEVRISKVARSSDWIETSYNNQSDPSSFFSMSEDSCGGSYGFNYQYCKKITVDHTQVPSDLENFPLLINITGDNDLKTVANGGRMGTSQGYDIVFRTDVCGNFDHEIEKYDGSAGDLVAWVRVPILSSSTDTEIYMYYGDSQANCPTENPDAVWDTNYEAVLHLQESGDGTSDEYRDSTSNDHHGTGGGLAGAGDSNKTPNRVTGKFGYAQNFDGSNDLIRLDSVSDGSWTAVTVQAWVKPDDTGDDRLFGKCWGTGNDDETWLLRKPSGGNFGTRMRTDTNYNGGYDPGSLSIGNWQLVAVTWDASDNQLRVYKNGVQQGATTLNGDHLFSNTSGETGYPDSGYVNEPTLGNIPQTGRNYNGKMQEARLSKVARSGDWLLTEYRNQNDPGNFYTISSCFEQTTEMTEGWQEDF